MNILSALCRPNSAGVIREAYSNYFTGEHGFYCTNSIFECKQLRCETYTLRSSRTWCCSRKNYYGNSRENKTERWKLIISILLLEIESSPSYARGCPSYSISPYDEFSAGIDTQKKIVCHFLWLDVISNSTAPCHSEVNSYIAFNEIWDPGNYHSIHWDIAMLGNFIIAAGNILVLGWCRCEYFL